MKEQEDVIFINDVKVTAYERGPLDVFIPMEPLCKAIGLDYEAVLEQTKEHPTFKKKLAALYVGESYAPSSIVVCLPLKYIMGWTFWITDEATEEVKFRMLMCHDAIYERFLLPYERRF